MNIERSSGILLHITSLPGPYGIGDLGPAAYNFIDFLKESGHSYWQLLPLTPTDGVYNHSPYSSHSAFAGNPLLVSPDLLQEEGYIELNDFPAPSLLEEGKVVFEAVETYKKELFEAAFKNFKEKKGEEQAAYLDFLDKHSHWLDNYCLYLALRPKFAYADWADWPEALRDRRPEALEEAREELKDTIEREKFIQFLFFSQWSRLVKYAHKQGIKLFGDVPFYVNHDSADCWANPSFFKLNSQKKPTHISGVPPDMFSETGQLWGTPVFDWQKLQEDRFRWWIKRLQQNLLLFDVVRLDHFRAFAAYWEVKASEETAINGKWVDTPGSAFFKALEQEYPQMPFIAEDLGLLDQQVYDLLEEFNFPGMKILQFAFGDTNRKNPYLPYNHVPNSVVYTGTHDNNTTKGWFNNGRKDIREHLENYLGFSVSVGEVHEVLHRMALQSTAKLAIVPMQDIIGKGQEGIMNIPGSTKGNWSWRLKIEEIPLERAEELWKWNELYGRIPESN